MIALLSENVNSMLQLFLLTSLKKMTKNINFDYNFLESESYAKELFYYMLLTLINIKIKNLILFFSC